jgi:hypothetical protein
VASADTSPAMSTQFSSGLSERSPRASETKGNGAVQEHTAEVREMRAATQPNTKYNFAPRLILSFLDHRLRPVASALMNHYYYTHHMFGYLRNAF